MRTPIRVVLLALLAVVLTGCFKADLDFEVNDDDTVDGSYVFALSKDASEAMADFGEDDSESEGGIDPEELEATGAEVTVEPYEEDDWVGEKVSFTGAPLEEFNALMAEDGDEWTIERDGDDYRFEANWTSEDMSEAGGDDTDEAEGFDAEGMEQMFQMMMAQAEFDVTLTFPGEITDTNGDVDGNTVTWEVDPTEPENEMYAVAEGGGFPLVPVLAGVGGLSVVLILGLAAVLLLRRKGA